MRIPGWALALPAYLTLLACSSVYVEGPVGLPLEQPLVGEELNGTWISAEGEVAEVRLTDPTSGTLILGVLEWDGETSQFKAENTIYHLRRAPFVELSDGILLTAEDKNEIATDKRYQLAGLMRESELSKGILLIYPADTKSLAEAIDAGRMPGRVKREDKNITVWLGNLSPSQFGELISPAHPYFHWPEPFVLRRP